MRVKKCYGSWTVLSSKNVADNNKHYRVKAVCVCGKEKDVLLGHLNAGKSTSCGCQRSRTHNMTHTPEYKSWSSMKGRCLNPNNDRYHQYGGRGIKVIRRWAEDFTEFYKDMGPRPEGTSLDRIDVDGHYTPKNCRWATNKEQMRNRRTGNLSGTKKTIGQLAEEYGISEYAIQSRLARGWNIRAALTTPMRVKGVLEKTKRLEAEAKALGLKPGTYRSRLSRGWDPNRAKQGLVDYARSISNKARKSGVSPQSYHYRLNQGWTHDQIVSHYAGECG